MKIIFIIGIVFLGGTIAADQNRTGNRFVNGPFRDNIFITSILRFLRNLRSDMIGCSWKVLLQRESILAESGILDKLLDVDQHIETVMEIYNSDNLSFSKSVFIGDLKQKHTEGCRLVITSLNSQNFPITDKGIKTYSLRLDEDYYIFLGYSVRKYNTVMNTFLKSFKYKLVVFGIHEERNENGNKCNLRGISMSPFLSESLVKINLDGLCSKKLDSDNKVDWKDLFIDFTKNFQGLEMKMSVPTKIKGFFEASKHTDGNWYAKRGREKFLLESIMSKLNFTTRLFQSTGFGQDESTAGGTGVQINGSWTGCVGDIISGKADFCPTCGPSFSRVHVVDFTVYAGHGWIIFVMGQPTSVFSWTAIFRAFQLNLWIAMVLVFIFAVLCMHFLTKFSISFCKYNDNVNNDNAGVCYEVWSLKKSVHYMFATLLGQDVPKPKSEPTRAFYIFWLFFALIISTIYVSKLVGYLTFPEVATIPHTFHDLANSDYKAGMNGALRGGMGEAHLKSSFDKLYKKMDLNPGDYNCFANGLVSKYACIIYKQTADYMMQKYFISSDFIYSSESTLYIATGWMVKKRALYEQSFSNIIMWTYNSGLIDKWEQLDYSQLRKARLTNNESTATTSARTKTSFPAPLTLHNFTVSFAILFIGNFAALITLFIERIHRYLQAIYGCNDK